jgi:hypothetical protein
MPSTYDRRQQAKHPATALAGPYGHPVHPQAEGYTSPGAETPAHDRAYR